jgi:hypothetical protein
MFALSGLQDTSFSREQLRDCRWEGKQDEGGLYEVCIVDNKWLVGRREQVRTRNLSPYDRLTRCRPFVWVGLSFSLLEVRAHPSRPRAARRPWIVAYRLSDAIARADVHRGV